MYFIVHGFLYLLSLLPLRILYLVSDGAYFFLYHVAGYRKKVVSKNLLIAFPEKPEEERKRIEKQFYKNFTDNFIETVKLITGKGAFASTHLDFDGRLFQEQFDKGNRVQLHLGHHFNWEMANMSMSRDLAFPLLMVYQPVQNALFERLMLGIRSSTGNHLLPANNLRAAMMPFRNTRYLLALIADQSPGDVSKAYWLNFFGRPTPFLAGPERGALAGNLAVVFAQIYKIKRGHYGTRFEVFTEKAASLAKGDLTRSYVRYLENAIRQHPEIWLWSHRRWKKEWKPEYLRQWIDEEPAPL